MSLTKDELSLAICSVFAPDDVLHVAYCDGVASVRVNAPKDVEDPSTLDRLAGRAAQAASHRASQRGEALRSITFQFMDHVGNVVATVQPGRAQGSSTVAQGHAPLGGVRAGGVSAQGPLPGVKHIIAVGAGKGGVGKSTVSLNLAVALSRMGYAVGLLDGDIYGPSMPTMLGLSSMETIVREGFLEPFNVHGVKAMTIGKLVDAEKPLIWRGPMAHGAFKQLVEQTRWGELDYLVIDLPPGTGDVSLTMAQLLKLTGAVVVCTPQRVAQDDCVRAVKMFEQLKVPVLGVVENMSYFVGDDAKVYDLFGRGGAEQMAQRLHLPFLGAIPITMSLRLNCDRGDPSANFEPHGKAATELAEALETVAKNVESQARLRAMKDVKPVLTIR